MTKTFLEWLRLLREANCHVCGELNIEKWTCELCNEVYCEDCSAPFNVHSQIDFNCCVDCYNYKYE